MVRKLVDREDLTGDDSGGVDFGPVWRIAGGSFWPILRLDAALRRATPWPASGVGIPRVNPEGRLCASCGGDCHGLSALLGAGGLGGGARGAWPCSKVSMMIMRPPQLGQGCGSVYIPWCLLMSIFSDSF